MFCMFPDFNNVELANYEMLTRNPFHADEYAFSDNRRKEIKCNLNAKNETEAITLGFVRKTFASLLLDLGNCKDVF